MRMLQGAVDTGERLLLAEQRDALEDARGDRGAGNRDSHWLENLRRLLTPLLDHVTQNSLNILNRERLSARQRIPGRLQALHPTVPADDLRERGRIVRRAVEQESDERPEFGQ